MTDVQIEAARPIVDRWASRFALRGQKRGLAVEDLQQEAWQRLVAVAPQFRSPHFAWHTFVTRTVSRHLLNITRRDLREVPFDSIAEPVDPDGCELKAERQQLANDILLSLPKAERVVVARSFGFTPGGESVREISRATRRTVRSVRTLFSRGMSNARRRAEELQLTQKELYG